MLSVEHLVQSQFTMSLLDCILYVNVGTRLRKSNHIRSTCLNYEIYTSPFKLEELCTVIDSNYWNDGYVYTIGAGIY